MRTGVGVAVLLLLGPGCIDDSCTRGSFQAFWQDPGTFERVPSNGTYGPLTVTEHYSRGFAFRAAWMDERFGAENYVLTSVSSGEMYASGNGDPQITVGGVFEAEPTLRHVRGSFAPFVQRLTNISGDALESAFISFMANRTETGYNGRCRDGNCSYYFSRVAYQVNLTGPARLDELFSEHFEAPTREPKRNIFRQFELEDGSWTFSFMLRERRVVGNIRGHELDYYVDADDRIQLSIDPGARNPEADRILAELYQTMDLGSPSVNAETLRPRC